MDLVKLFKIIGSFIVIIICGFYFEVPTFFGLLLLIGLLYAYFELS